MRPSNFQIGELFFKTKNNSVVDICLAGTRPWVFKIKNLCFKEHYLHQVFVSEHLNYRFEQTYDSSISKAEAGEHWIWG